MRLTPIEIRSHRFNARIRGYDTAEVEAFLDTVVSDFEEVVRENAKLRREGERLGRELEAHRSRERNIQNTLTTAHEVVEQLKRTAAKEAEVVVSQAELQAEKLLEEARSLRCDLQLEIAELRHLRNQLSCDLRQVIAKYTSRLDAYDTVQGVLVAEEVEPEAD